MPEKQDRFVPQAHVFEGIEALEHVIHEPSYRLFAFPTLLSTGGHISIAEGFQLVDKGREELLYAREV